MKNILVAIFILAFASNSYAQDQRRYSLDSMLGNLAEKFKEQMLTRSDYSKIKQVNQSQYKIAKELKSKALISIPKLMQQGKVIKKVGAAGQPGYLITYIEKDSVYQVLGLKVGDFLSKVNEAPLTDDKKIMEIFSNNKNAEVVRLELFRQNQKFIYTYNFI